MSKHYVKTLFSGWKEVNEVQYIAWCEHIYNGAIAMNEEQKRNYINEHTRIEEV